MQNVLTSSVRHQINVIYSNTGKNCYFQGNFSSPLSTFHFSFVVICGYLRSSSKEW